MLEKTSAILKATLRWVRFIYFLRFSLLLWFIPLVLVGLNMTSAKTLTSGIVTPDYDQQYVCVAFFLVSSAFGALIAARVVAINGPARWNEGLPPLLKHLLVNDNGRFEWVTIVGSQIPNLFLFWYFYANGTSEGVQGFEIWSGLAVGTALAIFVWWVANAWYYLTYEAPPQAQPPIEVVKLGENAARTILFPRCCFGLVKPAGALTMSTLEGARTNFHGSLLILLLRKPTDLLNSLIGTPGYVYPNGNLYEAHIFATIALGVFLGLYLTIWPLAAPVPAVWMSTIMLALMTAGVIFLLRVFWSATPGAPGSSLLKWKILLTTCVCGFWLSMIALYFFAGADRFPTLATLLIMSTILCWALAGIAFFADRYRVPVLTTLIVLMVIPRMLGWVGDKEEHYFSTSTVQDGAKINPVLTPAAILDARLPEDPSQGPPLIIVTATGGGLHASSWTATVLAELEHQFAGDDGRGEPFHKHLLLASSVSGGSVGLLTYLRELHEGTIDLPGDPGRKRMQMAAQCSSLEGIGWGLMYYDLQKSFVPVIPQFIAPSSGDGDLDGAPMFKDRTWALRKSIARNQNDDYCRDMWNRDTGSQSGWKMDVFTNPILLRNIANNATNEKLERELTLRNLLPEPASGIPAFTMNTTTIEKGERFLLANYRVPHYELDRGAGYPAESFVEVFGICNPRVPDLPLATAAQLSATFPYVSSATRVAHSVDDRSVHFVDGGYYDNDGTASALEFLRYALAPSVGIDTDVKTLKEESLKERKLEEKAHLESIERKLEKHPLRILLIEIRNSRDTAEDKAILLSGGHGAEKDPWNLFSQMGAPPEGFWNAGHESVTARNRAGLGLLERAYFGKLQIHRVVLDDRQSVDVVGTDPLSWSLTPKQRAEVRQSACPCVLKEQYDDAKKWFQKPAPEWKGDGQEHLEPAAFQKQLSARKQE